MMPKRPAVSTARGTRDPERVRAAALEASVKLFAERGFAGTSFQNISDACGISVGLIQYHFGSKDELYEAVKEHAIGAYLASQEPQFQIPMGAFHAFLEAGLRQYFRFLETHPAWPRLSAWAELEGDGRAWPGEHWLMDRLVERVEAGRRSRELRKTVDAELLLIVLAGIMQAWTRYGARYASRLAHLGGPAEREDAYLRFVLDLLRRGIGADAPPQNTVRRARRPSVKGKRKHKGALSR